MFYKVLLLIIVLISFFSYIKLIYLYQWILEKLAILFTASLLLKLIVGR